MTQEYKLPTPKALKTFGYAAVDGYTPDQMHAAYAAGRASRDGEIAAHERSVNALTDNLADTKTENDALRAEIESLKVALESAANFMRGMSFDPAIPASIKGALMERVIALDAATGENE